MIDIMSDEWTHADGLLAERTIHWANIWPNIRKYLAVRPNVRSIGRNMPWGKVVASHAEVARSIPGWAETAPIYTLHAAHRGYCPRGWAVWSVNFIFRLWRHCQ